MRRGCQTIILRGFLAVCGIVALPSLHQLFAEASTEQEPTKGPHGGRLLAQGEFQIEITIFERGVPPEFRVFAYEKGKPLNPSDVQLAIDLHRIAGRIDSIQFKKKDDYLLGDKVIEEPHSFDVKVRAEWKGSKHAWEFSSYEGRTEISPESAKESGIVIDEAGPAELSVKLPVFGRLVQDNDATVHVGVRFPGIVKDVRKRMGETVRQGDLLAIIESNTSLSRYEIRASMNGTIINRDITVGEHVSEEDTIFVLADLSKLFVDLHVNRQDFTRLKVGQPVMVRVGEGAEPIESAISYLAPVGTEGTQSILVRAPLTNAAGALVSGLAVQGDIVLEKTRVPVAVKKSALQTFRDWDVVFVQDGHLYEAKPLELGRDDGEWVEVTSGLEAGQKYVTGNSFVVKADVGKNGASHDH